MFVTITTKNFSSVNSNYQTPVNIRISKNEEDKTYINALFKSFLIDYDPNRFACNFDVSINVKHLIANTQKLFNAIVNQFQSFYVIPYYVVKSFNKSKSKIKERFMDCYDAKDLHSSIHSLNGYGGIISINLVFSITPHSETLKPKEYSRSEILQVVDLEDSKEEIYVHTQGVRKSIEFDSKKGILGIISNDFDCLNFTGAYCISKYWKGGYFAKYNDHAKKCNITSYTVSKEPFSPVVPVTLKEEGAKQMQVWT